MQNMRGCNAQFFTKIVGKKKGLKNYVGFLMFRGANSGLHNAGCNLIHTDESHVPDASFLRLCDRDGFKSHGLCVKERSLKKVGKIYNADKPTGI